MANENERKRSAGVRTVYHYTTAEAAETILKSGFRDAPALDGTIAGVWLSDVPLDGNDAFCFIQ